MTTLVFNRATGRLAVLCVNGDAEIFAAANFVDTRARGAWPLGTFEFDRHETHDDDAPDSAFGSGGILLFRVPGRDGMGIHGGRNRVPDALGRVGLFHATMGCLRVSEAAAEALLAIHQRDPIRSLEIR